MKERMGLTVDAVRGGARFELVSREKLVRGESLTIGEREETQFRRFDKESSSCKELQASSALVSVKN